MQSCAYSEYKILLSVSRFLDSKITSAVSINHKWVLGVVLFYWYLKCIRILSIEKPLNQWNWLKHNHFKTCTRLQGSMMNHVDKLKDYVNPSIPKDKSLMSVILQNGCWAMSNFGEEIDDKFASWSQHHHYTWQPFSTRSPPNHEK